MFISAFKKVFSSVNYILTALVVMVATFSFAVWLPNWKLITVIMKSDSATFIEKISIPLSLFGSITTNFTVISASYTILIAVLFGINISLLIYYIRKQRKIFKGSGVYASVGGVISGMFGIGCAACGTFILSAVLGIFGGASAVAFLPFGGEEFGFIGVGLLSYSIVLTSRKIEKPYVCE